jgi:transcriptional regulator with XRE-family HTH domain
MSNEGLKYVIRPLTEEDRLRHAQIRAAAECDFPPAATAARPPAPPGIPAKIRAAREARGMTWYALAQAAGIPNSGTIQDIEEGKRCRSAAPAPYIAPWMRSVNRPLSILAPFDHQQIHVAVRSIVPRGAEPKRMIFSGRAAATTRATMSFSARGAIVRGRRHGDRRAADLTTDVLRPEAKLPSSNRVFISTIASQAG